MHRHLSFSSIDPATLGRSWQPNIEKVAVTIGQEVWWLAILEQNTLPNLHNSLHFLKENLQLYLPDFHLHKGKMLFSASDDINNLMAST